MKTDLQSLMASKNIDALFITGPVPHNPAMYYFAGGAFLTHAELIVPREGEPLLFCGPMERDEAAKSGLNIKLTTDYDFKAMRKEAGGDVPLAMAMRAKAMLEDAGVTKGRVSLYGKTNIGPLYAMFSNLQKIMPEIEIIGEMNSTVLLQAMATKDEDEVERIREMGRITTKVVGMTRNYLASCRAKDGVLVTNQGAPVTIRDVKMKINLWLALEGVENPHETIFALGRDAGVPHSVGNPDDALKLGQTIVFDIFPCEKGGGYHYDFTRTWCLGYAPDAVQAMYDDVYDTYQKVMGSLELNAPTSRYQEMTCDLFAERDHQSIRDDPKLTEGYVHSLGHGLGLNLHEAPWFRGKATASETDLLAPGAVVTIEPGLYYPSKGMGCRLEDTVYVRPDGTFEILADFPLDLVIPVQEI